MSSSSSEGGGPSFGARVMDVVILTSLLAYLTYFYFTLAPDEKQNMLTTTTRWLRDDFNNPYSILWLIFFIAVFYAMVFLLGVPMTGPGKPILVLLVESKSWVFFVFLIFINFFKYVLNVPIVDIIYSTVATMWNGMPFVSETEADELNQLEEDLPMSMEKNTPATPPPSQDEVFNLSENLFTYDDAQTVCKSYGARLATYDEVEKSYNTGGEWCSYGWSSDQMALFPTQKDTWQKLKDKGSPNACGRPGINGGFFKNPYIKFGANCFGKKPKPSARDESMFAARQKQQLSSLPITAADKELQNKVKFFQDNADKLLIQSFNSNKWSAAY